MEPVYNTHLVTFKTKEKLIEEKWQLLIDSFGYEFLSGNMFNVYSRQMAMLGQTYGGIADYMHVTINNEMFPRKMFETICEVTEMENIVSQMRKEIDGNKI